jgi:hypothetical protein
MELTTLRGRWSIDDPQLGEATVFAGDRAVVMLFPVLAVLLYFAWPRLEALALLAAMALFATYLVITTWRTQFVVGERGFRFAPPRGKAQEYLWRQITGCQVEGMGRSTRLVVTLAGPEADSTVVIGSTLSARLRVICALMEARRTAYQPQAQQFGPSRLGEGLGPSSAGETLRRRSLRRPRARSGPPAPPDGADRRT